MMHRFTHICAAVTVISMGNVAAANAQIPAYATTTAAVQLPQATALPHVQARVENSEKSTGSLVSADADRQKQAYRLINQKMGLINNAYLKKQYDVISRQTAEVDAQIQSLRAEGADKTQAEQLSELSGSIRALGQAAEQRDHMQLRAQMPQVRQNMQRTISIYANRDASQAQLSAQ